MDIQLTLPSPRINPPTAVPPLRWGIVGAGSILPLHRRPTRPHSAASDCRLLPEPQRLAQFAAEHGIGATYADPTALIADPQIDVCLSPPRTVRTTVTPSR